MGKPTITRSGDVIPSVLGVSSGPTASNENFSNFKIMDGEIIKTYTIEDKDNNPGNDAVNTVYDVLVHRTNGSSEVIKRCVMSQPSFAGSINNFHEVLPPDTGQEKDDVSKGRDKKRSNRVLIGFMEGRKDQPIILASLPHPSKISKSKRPKKAKGVYMEGEFQGLNYQIGNDGEFSLTFNGPRKDDGTLVNKNGPTLIKIDKDGNVEVSTNKKQSIKIKREDQSITVDSGTTQILMDGKGDKIISKAKTYESHGSDVNRVHGKKILLSSGESSSPAESFVLGDTLKEFLTELLTEIGKIQHIGNMGAPTPPPMNMAQFEAMKSKYIESKKILSDFIKGEKK